MTLALHNVLRADVNYCGADGDGWLDSKIAVFRLSESVDGILPGLGLVDRALINCVGHGRVYQLAQEHAVFALFEQVVVVDW